MSKYVITSGSNKLEIDRHSEKALKFKLGKLDCIVLTEDLAAIVKEELPLDRAKDLFAEIEEKEVSKGKVRVVIKADKDIKQDENVCFTFDVTRYLDKVNKSTPYRGLRVAPASGIIY